MFLNHNAELQKGIPTPVYMYSRTDAREYDFAPLDVEKYHILNGQTYCENKPQSQMPIEESDSMVTQMAVIWEADKNVNTTFKIQISLKPGNNIWYNEAKDLIISCEWTPFPVT